MDGRDGVSDKRRQKRDEKPCGRHVSGRKSHPQKCRRNPDRHILHAERDGTALTRSPIKYHGGKSAHADWIISLMSPHTHYVEPFAGGLSVLFSKPEELVEDHSEVVNDLDKELINFFKVLQDDDLRLEMLKVLQFTPFSEEEFQNACSGVPVKVTGIPNARAAISFFIRNRQSRQGMGKSFATISRTRTRRGMNEQASAWLSAIYDLDSFAERLKRVVILNRDFREVIMTQDDKDCLMYIDPPYMPETRVAGTYEHEMTANDHAALLDLLTAVDGKFLLSGYHNDLYDEWAAANGYSVFEKETVAHSSGAGEKPKRTEVVWRNY